MQMVTSRTISPRLYPKLLGNNYFDELSSIQSRRTSTSLQPISYFTGQMSLGNFSLPNQRFSLTKKDNYILFRSHPIDSFPTIEMVLERENFEIKVKDFKVERADNTVQGELLYTRIFLVLAEVRKCSLDIKNTGLPLFNFSFAELSKEDKSYMLFRAKLARKLKFLEVFFNTRFYLPEKFEAEDIRQIEILFRGVTEGEFSIPFDNSIMIFNYRFDEKDLSQKKAFYFEFDDDLPILGKLFATGKIIFKIEKGKIANPKVLKNSKNGEFIENLKLNIFDYLVDYRFEKYSDSKRLLKNQQKLEYFKKDLLREEPEFLVALLQEYLSQEVIDVVAAEIIEGLLQFYDFPDRFAVLKPKLEDNQWRVPIVLTYPKHEPIWLADAFVDSRTGKFEMKISFDELLKKGKKKAKEVFSIG